MAIDTLKSLQKRIREATGPDRELDLEICKTFGRAPQDAIWEVDENLPSALAKNYKRGWTTPAYVDHRREYKRGVDAAFSERLPPEETAAKIKALDVEWDFKNAPPFGNVPNLTSDPDGIGACVALMLTVFPGALWAVGSMEEGPFCRLLVPGKSGGYHDSPHIETDHIKWTPPTVCAAMIDCAIAARIDELEAKEKADA